LDALRIEQQIKQRRSSIDKEILPRLAKKLPRPDPPYDRTAGNAFQ